MPTEIRADTGAQQRAAASAWRSLAVAAPLVIAALLGLAEVGVRHAETVAGRAAAVHLEAVRAGAEAAATAEWRLAR